MREDWVEIELDELCEKVLKVKRKEMPLSEKIKYLDIGAIDNHANKIISHKEYTWEDAPSRAQQIIKKDDVLFSTVRTYLKNIAKVNKEEYNNEIGSSGFTVLRVKKDVLNSDYLFFRSLSTIFLNSLNKLQRGTSYPAVRDKDVFAQIIPLPPLVEQKAIVKKIEELFSSLDSGIEDLKKAQDQLVIYRQAVLKKAFEGELTKEWREKQTNLPSADELLEQIKEERKKHYEQQLADWKEAVKVWEKNEKGKKPSKPAKLKELVGINADEIKAEVSIPENWIYKKIGNITDSIVPNRDKPKSFSGNIHWVTTPDLNLDSIKINYQNIEKGLTKEECLNYNARIIPVNSVIMTCVGMLGTSSIVTKEIVINQQLHAFLPANTYIPEYLAYLIRFNSSYLERSSTATTVKYLNKTKCNSLPFPVCSIQEQHQIVREIENRLSVCDKVEESIKESLQKATALRQSILKKAFEGKLLSAEEIAKCKADKNYEPASVLLEKIRAEKKKNVTKTVKKRKN